jgi:hypothetical protein
MTVSETGKAEWEAMMGSNQIEMGGMMAGTMMSPDAGTRD